MKLPNGLETVETADGGKVIRIEGEEDSQTVCTRPDGNCVIL